MLKRTPLNQVHREMGAKMVDFGGWDMPLHYGSQIEEHHRVRRAAGMFDVSHMLALDIAGAAARDFLRGLLANDVDKLNKEAGKALYSCMLNERGGVLDDLIVYRPGEGRYRLVVNAGTADKDLAWLCRQRDQRTPGLDLSPRHDLAMIAVQGPQARDKVWQALPAARAAGEALQPFQGTEQGQYFLARTGYTGEDGLEIMLPAPEAEALWRGLFALGVAPVGLGARDTLRLEAGMNLYGQDMDEDTSPLESGLAWTVVLGGERDFIGRAALQAAPAARRLAGLILLDKGVLRNHQKVLTPHGEGEITSGGFSPTLERSIALARLPAAAAPGQEVQVQVRDKRLKARIVRYPFVRNGAACYREG